MNATFTLAVATVVASFFGLTATFAVMAAYFQNDRLYIGFLVFLSFGVSVLFFAARLGDDWTRVKIQLTGVTIFFVLSQPPKSCEGRLKSSIAQIRAHLCILARTGFAGRDDPNVRC